MCLSDKKRIGVILGTRPEAIKLIPIILELKKRPEIEYQVCVTAQHREMLDQVLNVFDIQPDVDLDLMRQNQTLAELTARSITGIDQYLDQYRPDMILIQGDTTTVFSAALAAFYHNIPVGHVEAGLRTGNIMSPWPEEANRVLTSRIALLHFAPMETNRQNLLKEGVQNSDIYVTGNTVIDALLLALKKVRASPPKITGLLNDSLDSLGDERMVLITGHRRESFGGGFENICNAIAELMEAFPEIHFVYPMHLNPNVREPVCRILQKRRASNIHLIEPQSYLSFVALMNRAYLILTDSGGVQEEAPSLGKPVLVMRETTERPEAILAGSSLLVGTNNVQRIVSEVSHLLMNKQVYEQMSRVRNPFGDGKASRRIVDLCEAFLGREH
jgi:UDP-N-acetylglucosamine 2-epimerase (non-hydrolysing)